MSIVIFLIVLLTYTSHNRQSVKIKAVYQIRRTCMNYRRLVVELFLIFTFVLIVTHTSVIAQNEGAVHEITGHIDLEESDAYRVPNLRRGETLYVFIDGVTGNLDPLAVLMNLDMDPDAVRQLSLGQAAQQMEPGKNPLDAVEEILNNNSLAWNDDFDGKYNAAFQYKIPADGSYRLLVRSTASRETRGKYRLLIGVNTPDVLSGKAKHNKAFVLLDWEKDVDPRRIETGRGELSAETPIRYLMLDDIPAGDTLYVYVEALTGDLRPVLTLFDFGEKPLMHANYSGQEKRAVLQYTFNRKAHNFRLLLSAKQPDGKVTSGDYRIVLGLNSPEVLSGQGESTGRHILRKPVPVKIGVRMQQITDVNQKEENFGVVAELMLEWRDPRLAFNPEDNQERLKFYGGDSFTRTLSGKGIVWPEFTIYNLQGKLWIQNQFAVVFSDGRVIYVERFTATLQAPDFDFRSFPFDSQQFFIRIDSVLPEWYVTYELMEGYSDVGKKLGEEEWIITEFDTEISRSVVGERPVSRFNFRVEARRHLEYYIFRILLPIFIILIVSWVIFFLRDYSKRIDAAAANLLLFIAFNFTISNDLPRLGYLTFLDTLMIAAFVVTALVLITSVFLRRLVEAGKEEKAHKVDMYVVRWLYPAAYIGAVALATLLFG
jgi:hypothetical protein